MSSNKPMRKKVDKVSRFGCVGHHSSLARSGMQYNLKYKHLVFPLQTPQILHMFSKKKNLIYENTELEQFYIAATKTTSMTDQTEAPCCSPAEGSPEVQRSRLPGS